MKCSASASVTLSYIWIGYVIIVSVGSSSGSMSWKYWCCPVIDFITFVSFPSWTAFSLLVAASLILSLRSDLSLPWSRFLTHVIYGPIQFCTCVWVYVSSCWGAIPLLPFSSHAYSNFFLSPMTSSLQAFTIHLMSLLKCLLVAVHFCRLRYPKKCRLILCVITLGDQPSLCGDLKPSLWFLSGCSSWTALQLSFDRLGMISAGSILSRLVAENFSDMMFWYRWTFTSPFSFSSVRSS